MTTTPTPGTTAVRVARITVQVEMADGSTYTVESSEVDPTPPPQVRLLPYEGERSVSLDPANLTTLAAVDDKFSLLVKVPSMRSYVLRHADRREDDR